MITMPGRRAKKRAGPARPVTLPRVPLGSRSCTTQDEFWLQKGHSGSINAFRQLTNSVHKGGRKTVALPGGRLQPLFKNHSAPSKQELENAYGPKLVPGISAPAQDSGSQMKNVIKGACENLPDRSPTTVRVFMTSNYEDMKLERNAIFSKALPKIHEFCSKKGLLFELVDMQWGMENDLTAVYGSQAEARHREIAECQDISLGPHFVALLGDSYGQFNLVTKIPEPEYDVLHLIATDEKLANCELLTEMYSRDHNSTEPSYILQLSDNEANLLAVGDVLRKAAKLALDSGKMKAAQFKKYHMSGVAEDINQGIFTTKDPRSHCLCFCREFKNLKDSVKVHDASTYIDTIKSTTGDCVVDEQRQELNHRLAGEVMQHLGVGNFKQYFLSWSDRGMFNREDPEFKAYLESLCSDFVREVIHLIIQGLDQPGHVAAKKSEAMIYEEALFHSHQAAEKIRIFEGQKGLLWKVEKFLRDPRQNMKPFIVYGERGTGKSACMAKIGSLLKEWFTPDSVVVTRFLGTSSESSNIYRTVISITMQICAAYGLKLPNLSEDFSSLYKALMTFRSTIMKVSKEHAFIRPLFILLDGLDQLLSQDDSLRAMWAIRDLPTNVYIIVSTSPTVGPTNLLGALVTLVSSEDCTSETEKATEADAQRILNEHCSLGKYRLGDEQQKKVLETFQKSNQLLHLHHLCSQAVQTWRSYTTEEDMQLFDSPIELFHRKIDSLEELYGQNVIMFIVSYITVNPIGIHEKELLDLLSNNKEVMEEVHTLNLPPPENVLFFPPGLMARVKCHLKDFITSHLAYGKSMLAWSHQEFYVASAQKYSLIFPGIDESNITEDATTFTLMIQEHLANLYLSEYKDQLLSESARKAAPTDVVTVEAPQLVIPENQLKLERLPMHMKVLIPVEGMKRTKEHLLFNLCWLRTKLKAAPYHNLVRDIVEVRSLAKRLNNESVLDEDWMDLDILVEFFHLAQSALQNSTENLEAEIMGRLKGFSQESIVSIVTQAQTHILECQQPVMVPVHPCFTPPQQPLQYVFEGPTHVIGFLQEEEVVVLFSQKTGVDIMKIETGELLQKYPVNPEQKMQGVITGHGAEFVIIGHYSHLDHVQELSVWSSETGIKLVSSTFKQNFEYLALNKSDDLLLVATTMQLPGTSQAQRCLLGVNVQSKEITHTLSAEGIHEDGITRVLFATDNKGEEIVISLGSRKAKDLCCWSLKEQSLRYKLDPGFLVDFFEYSPAMNMAVCACYRDGLLHLIDLENGRIHQTVQKPMWQGIIDMYISNSGEHVLIATARNGVIIYPVSDETDDLSLVALPSQFEENQLIPSKMTMDEDENFLVIGYETGLILVFSMSSGDLLEELKGHGKRINSLSIKSTTLFSAAEDNTCRVWKYLANIPADVISEATNKQINPFTAIKSNGNQVAEEGGSNQKYPQRQEDISCVLLHPNGESVFTASYSGPIKLWALDTGKLLQTIVSKCEDGASHLYSTYRDRLLIGHCLLPNVPHAASLQVWKMDSLEPVKWEQDKLVQLYSSCPFPSGDKLLVISPSTINKQSGIVIGIYDLFEMTAVRTLHCNIFGSMDQSNLQLIGFTSPPPSETEMGQESEDGFDTESQKLYAVLDYFPQDELSFFFTFVISSKSLDVISMESHEPVHLDTVSPACCTVLPHGMCLTGTVDGLLHVWDVATQKVLTTLYDRELMNEVREGRVTLKHPNMTGRTGHDGAVTCVSLGQGQKSGNIVCATGGRDGKVKVWNVMQRRVLATVNTHTNTICTVELLTNNKILSGAKDQTVVLSDTATGHRISSFFAHGPVAHASCSIQRNKLAIKVGDRNSQIMIVDSILGKK